MIQVESQTFRGGFPFLEHLDLQWRLIGREGVDSDEAGGLSVRNIKRGLRPEQDKATFYSSYEAREREK